MDTHDPAARSTALSKIGPPAIALAVVAGLDGLLCLASLGMNLLGIASTPLVDARGDERVAWFLSGIWGMAWALFGLGVSGFLLWGALRMRELASYPLALSVCIVSMVPCLSPCCLLGVPFGIWGLVVMHDQAVRPHFPS